MTKVKGNSRSVQQQNWLAVSKHWCNVESDNTAKHEDWNLMFANHGEEDKIYPLTILEIAKAQNRYQKSEDLLEAKCKETRKRDEFSAY
jgi:hypothetical protein